ncbi:hypothetical protein GHT06_008154 [Daphnia sinensis]|uniref:Uncharacterized protein n=1 Tax=Daphnia sinensis TaxID=1820382 RepID=A0AAD5LKI2_9CRUS|nr:hypothetical protein GHT06_008154 [Daphnia sinensis]
MRSLTHENITIDFFFSFIVEICSRANRVKPASVRELHTKKKNIMRRVTASADDGCVWLARRLKVVCDVTTVAPTGWGFHDLRPFVP